MILGNGATESYSAHGATFDYSRKFLFHVMGKSAAHYYFDFDLILDRSRDMKKALIEDAA